MNRIPGLRYDSPKKFTLRQRLALATLPRIGAVLFKAMMGTCTIEERGFENYRQATAGNRHVVLAFWHETLSMAAYYYRDTGFHTLTSFSYDGELAARFIKPFGEFALRGSSSHGGADALRDMVEAIKHVTIGFTLDGPKGPRRVSKPGVALLAARAQVQILPVAINTSPAWRMNSWDRFIVPKPFSQMVISFGALIDPPPNDEPENIERVRVETETALNALQAEVD